MIVDSQVHLWKAESEDWKWVPGAVPQLPEPFTIERLVPMMDEAGVDRVVIVPPSWPGDRNDYALEAVRRYPTRFRIMGKIQLQEPKSAALLAKWREQPGMVGLRVIFNTPQTLLWLTDGTVDWFWEAAEKTELPVMCFAPGQTSAFGRVAERHPQLPLILDHMGAAAAMVRNNTITEAIGETVALAKYPNVSVKVSASPGLSREPYPWRDVTVARTQGNGWSGAITIPPSSYFCRSSPVQARRSLRLLRRPAASGKIAGPGARSDNGPARFYSVRRITARAWNLEEPRADADFLRERPDPAVERQTASLFR
jgi:predicted TIM-barrel fold metal-dependent hydrolase